MYGSNEVELLQTAMDGYWERQNIWATSTLSISR